MAKEKMVTRSFKLNKITALCFDMVAGKAEDKVFTLGVDFVQEKGMEIIRKHFETDTLKPVAIKGIEQYEQLRGMSETRYMQLARKMKPRGTDGRTRERLVTRTIAGYTVHTRAFVIAEGKLTTNILTVGADFDEENALAYVRKNFENALVSYVTVDSFEKFEQLYGMSEKEFIENSIELPPRTVTKDEDENAE